MADSDSKLVIAMADSDSKLVIAMADSDNKLAQGKARGGSNYILSILPLEEGFCSWGSWHPIGGADGVGA